MRRVIVADLAPAGMIKLRLPSCSEAKKLLPVDSPTTKRTVRSVEGAESADTVNNTSAPSVT